MSPGGDPRLAGEESSCCKRRAKRSRASRFLRTLSRRPEPPPFLLAAGAGVESIESERIGSVNAAASGEGAVLGAKP
eukprot:8238100-Alexandrium_andersonii.AAC.1